MSEPIYLFGSAECITLDSAMRKHVFGQRRPGLACAFAQSDQGIRCRKQDYWILKNASMESKCPDETAHVQDYINRSILRMFKGIVSLDAANFMS